MCSLTRCPTETICEIFKFIPRRNCLALLTLCKTIHPICAARVYEFIFVYLPDDTWKFSFLLDKPNRKYTSLVRTFIVAGAGGKDARIPLHVLCAVLQRMDGLRTLILPSTEHFQHIADIFIQHGITQPISRADHERKTAICPFLPRLEHITMPTPNIAAPLHRYRNISSLSLTKPLNVSRLDVLLSIISTQPSLRHVGICVGQTVNALVAAKAILRVGRQIQTLSISKGLNELLVSNDI